MALVGGAILTVLVSGGASIGLWGRRQLGARSNIIRHIDRLDDRSLGRLVLFSWREQLKNS